VALTAIYESSWTYADGQLNFTDIKSDEGGTYVFGHQPWTRTP
jgi:hypothetical protein